MTQCSGGHLVAKALREQGITHIFTLSGAHILPIYEGCLNEGIRIIDCRHEQAAAFAAEGWSKITGKAGVCVATAGPGVANTVTAVANAFRNSTPLVIIGGTAAVSEQNAGAPQELSHIEYMTPITKYAVRVLEADKISEYIRLAFEQANSPDCGPVFLEIPRDVCWQTVTDTQSSLPTRRFDVKKRPDQIDTRTIEETVKLLALAERPIIVAGSGVWWANAAEQLKQLVEIAGSPVYLISLARGTISPEHSLYFSRNRDVALGKADVIVVVGTPLDFRLGYGKPPAFNAEAGVIRIVSKSEEAANNRGDGIVIAGDIQTILAQISSGMPSAGADKKQWVRYLREKENALIEKDRLFITSDAVPIHPLRLCYEIKKTVDPDTTIIADGGDIVRFASHVVQAQYPAHWLDPGPMGTLGVGGGYALAAKLLRPDKPVLIINGDGTFGLSCMEFDTMARHQLNVVSVIGNDSAWSQVRHIQLGSFKNEVATKLSPLTRYDKLVESLGGHGELVQAASDIRPALERALTSGKPACVNVITDGTVSYSKYRAW